MTVWVYKTITKTTGRVDIQPVSLIVNNPIAILCNIIKKLILICESVVILSVST